MQGNFIPKNLKLPDPNRPLKPRFPQKPQFATTVLLIHSVQGGRGRALPPVRWMFEFTVLCRED